MTSYQSMLYKIFFESDARLLFIIAGCGIGVLILGLVMQIIKKPFLNILIQIAGDCLAFASFLTCVGIALDALFGFFGSGK